MEASLLQLMIPISGISIILFCALSFFFPYGEKFVGKVQKLKGFGIELEISVMTLFILIGVGLSLTSTYLYIKDYENSLKKLSFEKNKIEQQKIIIENRLSNANFFTMIASVQLDDGSSYIPNIENLNCWYTTTDSSKSIDAKVLPGVSENTLRVELKNIKNNTFIRELVVKDTSTNKKWKKINFMPFEPLLKLDAGAM